MRQQTIKEVDPEILQRASVILKTLGHPIRLAIIDTLAGGERNVSEIQEFIGEPQAITSQHLRLMEQRNILISRKEGVQVFYRLKDVFITKILECVRSCGIE